MEIAAAVATTRAVAIVTAAIVICCRMTHICRCSRRQ
jgi:hypothetical protein